MGRHIRSAIFKVGGYDWAIRYYPEGPRLPPQGDVVVALELVNPSSDVPRPDIIANLHKLLGEKEGTDVSFDVQGVTFDAHKIILAMRSPVFKAELYGSMMETRMHLIKVEDMQPEVFQALLHFIYTDSFPSTDGLDSDNKTEMVKHLLVAADRYAMERLKLMCEHILSQKISVENVAAIFQFSDQYNCHKLKNACIEFMVMYAVALSVWKS
ncbi:hypothetical protein PR202_ga27643 [Eleusine coracana subsp. coracana]|uniref:BTB domain-containing protein n=1 Tax=Eleusine coracana subsp. coracana TaxID=191504 RepID=A0AAV5DHH9_ELECO|nr:hypothetical protein PR202_ga27643 [Eleusine coracana subsp. coracana]